MWIGHRKEIWNRWRFERLPFVTRKFSNLLTMANSRNQPVDKTKLSCNTTHRRSNTVSLETHLFF